MLFEQCVSTVFLLLLIMLKKIRNENNKREKENHQLHNFKWQKDVESEKDMPKKMYESKRKIYWWKFRNDREKSFEVLFCIRIVRLPLTAIVFQLLLNKHTNELREEKNGNNSNSNYNGIVEKPYNIISIEECCCHSRALNKYWA